MAIVTDGPQERSFYKPTDDHDVAAHSVEPTWYPDAPIGDDRRSMFTPLYGLTHFHHLFTSRQLVTLTGYSELVTEARKKVEDDALVSLTSPGQAEAYANAVATYLAFAVDKMTTTNCAICTWQTKPTRLVAAFSRQAIPMVWDFAEANPFSGGRRLHTRCWVSL